MASTAVSSKEGHPEPRGPKETQTNFSLDRQNPHMGTNLKIDDALLFEDLQLSGFRTKHEVVEVTLQPFVLKRRPLQFLNLKETIDFDPNHGYRKHGNREWVCRPGST